MTTTPTVLKEVDIVQLDISIWTGSAKMEASDLVHVDPGDLPDKKVATTGTKKLINTDDLKQFTELRAKAEALCNAVGVKMLSGWAVPHASMDKLMNDLDVVLTEFNTRLDQFINDYDVLVQNWIDYVRHETQNGPETAERIELSKLPVQVVRNRFKARMSVFQVSGSPLDRSKTMGTAATDLHSNVLGVVTRDLAGYVEKIEILRNNQKPLFRSTVRTTIRKISERLKRFSFCDPVGFPAFAAKLDASVVGAGPIEGMEYHEFAKLIGDIRSVSDLEAAIKASTATPSADKLDGLNGTSLSPSAPAEDPKSPAIPEVQEATPSQDAPAPKADPIVPEKEVSSTPAPTAKEPIEPRNDVSVSAPVADAEKPAFGFSPTPDPLPAAMAKAPEPKPVAMDPKPDPIPTRPARRRAQVTLDW